MRSRSLGRRGHPKICLKHAEECDRLSALATLDAIKHALMECATMWRKLAAESARSDDTATNHKQDWRH